jgi:hypothetical protein
MNTVNIQDRDICRIEAKRASQQAEAALEAAQTLLRLIPKAKGKYKAYCWELFIECLKLTRRQLENEKLYRSCCGFAERADKLS